MSMKELMAAGNSLASGEPDPEGVSFDGTNDYLSRSSDLTGNADGKTFTFSCWTYAIAGYYGSEIFLGASGDYNFWTQLSSGGDVYISARNTSNTTVFKVEATGASRQNTWNHIVCSIDLTSTSTRYIYVNDAVPSSITWVNYTNSNIDFTSSNAYIGKGDGNYFAGRIAHVFLDYTYRDLSIEANRRLFITADGKPADGQSSVDTASSDFLDISARGPDLVDICFNDDGTRLLIAEGSTDDIFQYNLSTAFDLSTASYSGNKLAQSDSTYLQDIQFKDNDTKIYFGGNGSSNAIHQYNLSTANDISTASSFGSKAVSSVVGANRLFITDDGSKMFVGDNYKITKWNLSTNFDITTASHVNTKVLPYKIASIQCNANGTEMYLANGLEDTMVTYTLSIAYDVTTASTKSIKSLAYMDTTLTGAIFNNDGSKLFISADNNNKVYEMAVGTNFDATTAVYGALQGNPQQPILYLPMTDAATAGSNSGTGGDFTVNGVMDTAGRGPNQWNCSASTFDGSADYLSRSSITGLSDGKQFTFSCVVNGGSNHGDIFSIGTGSWPSKFAVDIASDDMIRVAARNSSGTSIIAWYATLSQRLRGATNLITVSVDTTNQSGSKVFINNVDSGGSFYTFTNDSIDFTASEYFIGADYSTLKADSVIGELYFDTAYIDLATDNPFWDADTNRPKPVRQVISETGTTPLIALPLRGNDAGNNLGTGGDFTVNSGPFTGARGGSEFWARSANFDGALGTGLQNSDSIASDTKTYTYLISFKKDSATGTGALLSLGSASTPYMHFWASYGSDYHFTAYGNQDGFGSAVYQRRSDYNSTSASDTWYTVLGSIDLNNAKDHMYLNGSNQTRASTNFNNAFIESSNITQQTIGARNSVREDGLDGDVVVHYFSTDYIDFSQESNRNLFVDQLGYPKDLTPAIEAGTIADPLIYMKFDDTSALGTNSGTGGNFTVNGTVTAGADVDPN